MPAAPSSLTDPVIGQLLTAAQAVQRLDGLHSWMPAGHSDARAPMAADRLRGLGELIDGRYWWRHTQ
jgi:hypothetical protein